MRAAVLILVLTALANPATAAAPGKDSIELIPRKITLRGLDARERLLVEIVKDGQYRGQLTNGIDLQSSNARVVKIEDGVAIPIGHGSATISVSRGGQTA